MAPKKNSLTLALLALVATVILAACASSPSPTATPAPTATPTPVPPQVIKVDPKTVPADFLAAIPSAEVDCATSAIGGLDRLTKLVSQSEDNTDDISRTQLNVLGSCISNATVQRVILGQLELETGGLSPETTACVSRYTDGIDFASLFSGQVIDQDTVVSTLQALFCLSPGERKALENSDQTLIEITQLGGIDALECAIDRAGTDQLAAFAGIFDDDGSVDLLAVGEFMPFLIDCGVVEEDSFQSAGITSAQLSCLFEQLDPEALASFLAITKNPSATPDLTTAASLFAAMGACGLDLQEIIEKSGSTGIDPVGTGGSSVPSMSADLLVCLVDNGVSSSVVSNYAIGLADTSDPKLTAALALCEGEASSSGGTDGMIVVPDGSGGTTSIDPATFDSLPITAEQVECLVAEMGADQLEGIVAGTVSPLVALGALGACNISIADLLAGQ